MKKVFIFALLFLVKDLFAQDPIFTQTFMIPETLNSGFTGSTESTNVGMVQRVQWPTLDLRVTTQYAFFDTWIDGMNSGVGLSILNHKEATTNYTFTQVNFNYALAFQISREWYFRPSVSIGLGMKNLGFQNILLEDQINIGSGAINGGSIDPSLSNKQRTFFDFSSSLLFHNDNSWIGITLKHLNKPNISFTAQGDVPLNMFLSLHSAIELPLAKMYMFRNMSEKHKFFILSNFMNQGQYIRLDIGTQYVYDKFSIGFLAATNPKKSQFDNPFLTSINAFVGIKWKGWKFSYSQDFTTTVIGNTGGVYEIVATYDFGFKNFRRLDCPKFF